MDNQSVGHSHSGAPAGKEGGRHCSLQPDGGAPGGSHKRARALCESLDRKFKNGQSRVPLLEARTLVTRGPQ